MLGDGNMSFIRQSGLTLEGVTQLHSSQQPAALDISH